MQVPILSGIYTDDQPDFRTSYPRNLVPVPKAQGISAGYLRPSDGIEMFAMGAGLDRGGINWNGVLYRVMGTKLQKIDSAGTVTTIGDVGGASWVTLTYSFDYLAIASNNNLFLYDGTTLTQVTDLDLGVVLDVVWIDGYFMTTDGEFLVVSELGDPFSVNPLKYGSSEIDPDAIKAILKQRNEIYALNRYTIEVFDNVGGNNFPFTRIDGAQMQRGAIGTHACCVFIENIAFLGGKLDESPAIWLGSNGNTVKISTREIDQRIHEFTEVELSNVMLEAVSGIGHDFLYLHLPNETLVYDHAASLVTGQPTWHTLDSGVLTPTQYRAVNFTWVYDKWLSGDPTTFSVGHMVTNISSHYGNVIGWEFGTNIVYNEGQGAIFHALELVSLTGRVALGKDPVIWTSYTLDGVNYSQEKPRNIGKIGNRNKRIQWLNQGMMKQWRAQKFRGTSDAHMSIPRLEVRLEPLVF